jgi:hypothetical protein
MLSLTYSGTAFTNSDESGYDETCRIYTEAYNTNMPIGTLSNYVLENIKKRVRSEDAREAHQAILHAAPPTRYGLFKSSAEHTLGHNWDCKAMERIMKMHIE